MNRWLFTAEMGLGDITVLLKLHQRQYSLVGEKVHPKAAAVHITVANLSPPAGCVLTAISRF